MGIHDNTVNITPPEVALTSDITANLSHINPLDNTTSMGVRYDNSVLYIISVDITLLLIKVTSDY